MIISLPGGLSLDGAVITADALHTQRATADYVHGRGADFILPAKDNQPGLSGALDALPWRDVPVTHAASNATTRRATAAHEGTQDRGALAHRPAPWPELIKMRSFSQASRVPARLIQ